MRARWLLAVCCLVALLVPLGHPASASAAANSWPHDATGGFATPDGHGFWVMYANGDVAASGTAHLYGNAAGFHLNAPITGGAPTPTGRGYWLVAADGGIFGFGDARFHGSMGGVKLNAPIFAMAPTRSGLGYWLVARDGGIFGFGDAHFYGSAGGSAHAQPIVGITASPDSRGYRMVAKDGAVFAYGSAHFYGSLPGVHVPAVDVVALAPTPTGSGYWIARASGHLRSFGTAPSFSDYTLPTCDVVVGVFANPRAVGYRLVLRSGATIPYGHASAGASITGTENWCHAQTACASSLTTAAAYQAVLNTRGPVFDGADGGTTVGLPDGRRVWLFGDTFTGPTDALHVLPGATMLRNSLAVESGNCITFRLGGTASGYDYFPRPFIAGDWYWPTGGIVDAARGVLLVPAMLVNAYPTWHFVKYDLFSLDLESLAVRSVQPLPMPGGMAWGEAVFASGSTVYLYAHGMNSSLFSPSTYVARMSLAHVADGAWQFSTGVGWSSSVAAARPMSFHLADGGPDMAPSTSGQVFSYGAGYLFGSSHCDLVCNDVTAWYASSPAGPWVAVNASAGRVATEWSLPNQIMYAGHMIWTRAGWLAAWSRNGPRDLVPYLKLQYGVQVAPATDIPSASVLAAR